MSRSCVNRGKVSLTCRVSLTTASAMTLLRAMVQGSQLQHGQAGQASRVQQLADAMQHWLDTPLHTGRADGAGRGSSESEDEQDVAQHRESGIFGFILQQQYSANALGRRHAVSALKGADRQKVNLLVEANKLLQKQAVHLCIAKVRHRALTTTGSFLPLHLVPAACHF
jgi:hypothetical protein